MFYFLLIYTYVSAIWSKLVFVVNYFLINFILYITYTSDFCTLNSFLKFIFTTLSLLNPASLVKSHSLNWGNNRQLLSSYIKRCIEGFYIILSKFYQDLLLFVLSVSSKPLLFTNTLQSIQETGNSDFQFKFNTNLMTAYINLKVALIWRNHTRNLNPTRCLAFYCDYFIT